MSTPKQSKPDHDPKDVLKQPVVQFPAKSEELSEDDLDGVAGGGGSVAKIRRNAR